jgi:hypothetical protein
VKPISQRPSKFVVIVPLLLLMLLATGLLGCAQTGKMGIQVIPLNNRDVLTLSADDIVNVMRRAGFSDMQILQFGTEVRNALLQSGAAQIKIHRKTEAVFAIKGDDVYITTRLRGNFVYNVNAGWISVSR